MWRFGISFAVLAALTGCAGNAPPPKVTNVAAISIPKEFPPQVQCAPFVREISGLPLHGDAWTWWDQAAGRFARGDAPKENAVLVLRPTKQLPNGHVAVVHSIVNLREITVSHANWGTDEPTRRMVHNAMPVIDVSAGNDWSQLRFWNVAAQAYGKVYPAYGFILPRAETADMEPVW